MRKLRIALLIMLFLYPSCRGIDLEPNRIGHWKMNENTASDNDELVTNGDFANWTSDNPDSWTLNGESGNDPEISEAATGEAHADTPTLGGGMCNIYTSDGTSVNLGQTVTVVIGKEYKVRIVIDTITAGGLACIESNQGAWNTTWTTAGTKTFTFVATRTDLWVFLQNQWVTASDVTVESVSIKLCAAEDSSDNDHDGLLQEHTADAHVAGKINGAFDFDGSSDYIEIVDHDDFSFGDGTNDSPFSVSAWIYMDADTPYILTKSATGQSEYRFYLQFGGKFALTLHSLDDTKRLGRYYDTALVIGQWYYLIATYDGGGGADAEDGIKLYVDGARKDDTDYPKTGTYVAMDNGTAPVYIGRLATSYANGQIDNVTIFDKELSQDEVSFLYNNGSGRETYTSRSSPWSFLRIISCD